MINHLSSLTILFPLLGVAGLCLGLFSNISQGSNQRQQWLKWIGFSASALSSACALILLFLLNKDIPLFQGTETISWIDSLSISYMVGIDGLNAPLLLLIAIVFPLLIVSEWEQKRGKGGIQALFLVLQAALFGVVLSQNLFLTFFFWSLSALPFYFLFAIWGDVAREKAAFRYLVTSSLGSAFLFVVLILVYYSIEPNGFVMRDLLGGKFWKGEFAVFGHEFATSKVAFFFFALSFVFRVPVWPIHGWFTYIMTQAPASVAVAFTGVFVPVALSLFTKLGYLLFPAEMSHVFPYLMGVGEVCFVFATVLCVVQRELRMLFAYLCMAQVGLTIIGLSSATASGVIGSLYHELAFGLALSGFGFFIGLLRERSGSTRFLNDEGKPIFGGLVHRSPGLTLVTALVFAGILCIPGLGGFVGQALILIGGYSVLPFSVIVTGICFVILIYGLFQAYMRVFLGQSGESSESVTDLTIREKVCFLPLVFLLIFFGLYPKPILDVVRPSVAQLLSVISG